MSEKLTRDEAREAWAASGLCYADITPERLEALRRMINDNLRRDRPIRGFCARGKAHLEIRSSQVAWADIRCSAYYFNDRQAVTFEPTGFIGFAGWASDENVQPILRAFVEWLPSLTSPGPAGRAAISREDGER